MLALKGLSGFRDRFRCNCESTKREERIPKITHLVIMVRGARHLVVNG